MSKKHENHLLLPEDPEKIEPAKCVEEDEVLQEEYQFDCDHLSYADAVFSVCIVAPLVVSVWRGTWSLMEMQAPYVPHAQTYVLGILVHLCFAFVRNHLLQRSVKGFAKRTSWCWLKERMISRLYTYVFILSNIMHWRGGWGLFDATVAAILPEETDPHRPVLLAAMVTVLYLCSITFRSSRNMLASPYFLFTDGKEPTYFFTTRFQTNVLLRSVAWVPIVPTGSYLRRAERGRDAAIMQLGGAGGRAQSVGVGAMRGSTAGLADTVAGGGRARAALLHLADAVFASVVVAPAVVAYWKATWTLLDLYALPDSPVASAAVCAIFGLTCNLVVCVAQTQLARLLTPATAPHPWWWYVLSRAYTGAAGVACVAAWRGVWNLLNECTGDSARTLLSTTAAATLSLAALRSLRNICAAPFAVAIDSPQDYFDVPTMFRTNSRETMLYVLDCVFSVGVVGSLVVFVWRGSWALLDFFLYPGDVAKSSWCSLTIGYALVVVTFSLQAPVRWAAARLHGAPRLLLADVYHLLSFLATVNVWRGVWGLLDVYFFPDNPKLSNWCCHIISLTLLILLNCSNSILVRGVYIDAEEPAGECVVFPCHYLRLYFHKERTKKRHKALTAAAKKPEDSSVPLQIPEEKV